MNKNHIVQSRSLKKSTTWISQLITLLSISTLSLTSGALESKVDEIMFDDFSYTSLLDAQKNG